MIHARQFKSMLQALRGSVPAVCGLLLACSPVHGQLLWSEEFDTAGVPDENVWSYDLGATGWGNQELQEYTSEPANVRVEDGHLVITVLAQDAGAPFTSGRIRTQDKVIFKYGTVEARIRMPDLADGLWPAFWTLGNSFSQVGWPACGEIDVVEMGSSGARASGLVNRRVGSTAHWERDEDRVFYGRSLDLPEDLDGEFHVFRMDWTPGGITTFIDGQPIWIMDTSDQGCFDCAEFHDPHFLILNVAVGGTYPGIYSASQITAPLPAEMRVDYIRIYDNGFTELGGSAIEGAAPDAGPGHSGSWFSPAQDGHGFSIEFGSLPDGSPLAVVYWYVYDDQGNPMFLVGTGVPDGNVLDVEFESPVGMVFGQFDPLSVTREDGGSGRFVFPDRDNAVFSYTPSGFTTARWGHAEVESLSLIKLFDVGAH